MRKRDGPGKGLVNEGGRGEGEKVGETREGKRLVNEGADLVSGVKWSRGRFGAALE